MISGKIAALPELTSLAGSRESPRSASIPSESTELLTAGSEIEIFFSKKLLPAELCCLSSTRDFLHRDPGPGLLVVGDAAHGGVDDGLPHICWGPVGGVSFRRLAGEDDDDDSSSSTNPTEFVLCVGLKNQSREQIIALNL